MLNAHPDITMPPEFHFVSQYIANHPHEDFSETMARLSSDRRFARLNLTTEEITKRFLEGNLSFSLAKLYEVILRLYSSKKGVRIIGDKAPKNIEYLPVLKRIFPEASVIHLIRDPRDVYLSRTKAKWSSSRYDLLQFLAYRSQLDQGRRIGPQLFAEHYQEILYEKLLHQPSIELESVCRLLGVSFDDSMLNFSDSAKELVFSDELTWKKEALGPLLTQNMNKWRKELPVSQILRIEAACAPVFEEGLYDCSNRVRSVRDRIKHLLINRFMSLVTKTYQIIVAFKNWRALKSIN